jgi:hypothetical protein
VSQNTNSAEYEEFKRRCERQRQVAKTAPCYHPGMAVMDCYEFALGPWTMRLTLDRFVTPSTWHGSISYLQEVGSHEVRDEQGHVLFDAPEEGMMRAEQWPHEIYDEAHNLLGDLFGPLIAKQDTRVVEARLGFCLHFMVSERDAGTLDS